MSTQIPYLNELLFLGAFWLGLFTQDLPKPNYLLQTKVIYISHAKNQL
jgi:hypothetical protein